MNLIKTADENMNLRTQAPRGEAQGASKFGQVLTTQVAKLYRFQVVPDRKIRYQKSSPKRHQLGLMGESWVKIMGFNNDCPGDTDELTGTSHTGDFVGFAAREQPLING